MQKIITLATLLLLPFSFFLTSFTVQAASEDECAIWLCLPTGFGQGCSGAKKAFHKRNIRHKPPLPRFDECSVDSNSDNNTLTQKHASTMTSKHGYVAVIAEQRTCSWWKNKGSDHSNECGEWDITPSYLIKDTRCTRYGRNSDRWESPKGCTRTLQYAETYMDGMKYGETFYW